jgi:uncharacterized protein YndB with AHSA1/START domain
MGESVTEGKVLTRMNNRFECGTRVIERSLVLKATTNEVYMMLSQPSEIVRWFSHRASREGDVLRLEWDFPHRTAVIDCLIVRDVPGRAFSFRWESECAGRDTVASFELLSEVGGTRVVFCETGFGDGPEWDKAIASQSEGWDEALDTLAFVLGRGKTRQIIKETVVPYPPERVFHAFTDSRQLMKWFAREAYFDPRQGAPFLLRDDFPTDGTGCVQELTPGKRIRLSWRWYLTPLPPTEITIALTREGKSTRVRLEHSLFGSGPEWDQEYQEHEEGWSNLLGFLWNHLYSDEPSKV